MELIGTIITYIIMACCVVGGVSYIIDDQSELGQSFNEGLRFVRFWACIPFPNSSVGWSGLALWKTGSSPPWRATPPSLRKSGVAWDD